MKLEPNHTVDISYNHCWLKPVERTDEACEANKNFVRQVVLVCRR